MQKQDLLQIRQKRLYALPSPKKARGGKIEVTIGNGGLDQPVELLETVTDREKRSVTLGNVQ